MASALIAPALDGTGSACLNEPNQSQQGEGHEHRTEVVFAGQHIGAALESSGLHGLSR